MNSQNLFRPTDIHDMLERNQLFYTDAAIRAWRAFKPRASDIIIATFPKSGTTWMQQILHTLRTGGDMDFEEISMVVPWMEIAYDMGIDLGAEQPAPRLFKSHLPADQVPPGARYIVIFRNSADVLRSYYEFMDGWFFEPGSISITEFAEYAFFDQSGLRITGTI